MTEARKGSPKGSADGRDRAEHDMYVRRLATGLRMNGPVSADLPGWDRPSAIQGNGSGDHLPDIEARLGLMHCVIEVETADSMADPASASRWLAFSRWAEAPGRMFLLAVPSSREQDALARLEALRIGNVEVLTV